jgi:hypothetical protein
MTLQSATTTDAEIITTLQPSDILLGRGAPIAYYEGNVRFRELIATRKMEYMSTGRHHRKREIAEQIFEEVRKRGGRFLVEVQMVDRSIAATVAANARSSTVESSSLVGKIWKVAEDCIALEKVKQTLREKHSLERRAVLPMGAAASDDNGMQGGNDETKAADGATGEIVKETADETEAAHSMRDTVKESASEQSISNPPSKEMTGNETADGSTAGSVLEERKVNATKPSVADSAQKAPSSDVERSGNHKELSLGPAPPFAMLASISSPTSETPSTNPAPKALSRRGRASQGQQQSVADALLTAGVATASVAGPTTMELPCASNDQRSLLMNSMALEIMRQQQQQAMRDQQQQQVTLLHRQRIAQLEWQLLQQQQAQRDHLALSQAISSLNASAPESAGLMSFQHPLLASMSLPAGITTPSTLTAGWPVTMSTNNASSILDNLLLSSAASGGARSGAANGTPAMRPSLQDPPRSLTGPQG